MLAHVERREVKAEGFHAADQAPPRIAPGVLPPVRREAAGDQAEIVEQLARVFVRARPPVVGGAQAFGDLAEEHAVGHAVVPRRGSRLRRRHQ